MTTITLYQFNKRINSTKQPGAGVDFNCLFKDMCGVIKPIVLLDATDLRSYNYAQWDGRYYWIDEVISVRNSLWEIHMTIDALATYKSYILETTAFVQYAASNYNLLVSDVRTVPTVTNTLEAVHADLGLFDLGGTYYLSTVGSGTSNNSFCNTYAMTGSAIGQVANILTTNTGFLEEAKLYYSSAIETLVEAHYIPVSQPTSGTTVKLGDYDTGVGAGNASQSVGATCTITPPWKGNYLDSDAYTRFTLYLPFCGAVHLGVSDFLRDNIVIYCSLDLMSGNVAYSIGKSSNSDYVATYSGNCATKLPITSYKSNWGELVSGTVSVVESVANVGGGIASLLNPGDFLGGNPIKNLIGDISGLVSNATNFALTAPKRTPSVVGSITGSAVKLQGLSPVLVVETIGTSESITAKQNIAGLPLYRTRTLSGLSGYVQTAGASVSAPATRNVLNAINSALDGGVYIE